MLNLRIIKLDHVISSIKKKIIRKKCISSFHWQSIPKKKEYQKHLYRNPPSKKIHQRNLQLVSFLPLANSYYLLKRIVIILMSSDIRIKLVSLRKTYCSGLSSVYLRAQRFQKT